MKKQNIVNFRNKKYEAWAENLEWLDLLIYLKANGIIWSQHNFVELYQKQKQKGYKKKNLFECENQEQITKELKKRGFLCKN
jgi:hypothetical protein